MGNEKLALSPAEAAQQLGVNVACVYALCHRADFPAVQISPRRYIIPRAALEKWLESQAVEE